MTATKTRSGYVSDDPDHVRRMRAIESTYRLSRDDRDENAGQMNVLAAVEPEDDEFMDNDWDGHGRAVAT